MGIGYLVVAPFYNDADESKTVHVVEHGDAENAEFGAEADVAKPDWRRRCPKFARVATTVDGVPTAFRDDHGNPLRGIGDIPGLREIVPDISWK